MMLGSEKKQPLKMRHAWALIAVACFVLTASTGSAFAAGAQKLCVGKPSRPITATTTGGKCRKGQKLVVLATQSQVGALQGQLTSTTAADATLTGEVSTLQGQVSSLQGDDTTLTSNVSALQTTLSKVSYNPHGLNGLPMLTITGANLQVVSGAGSTTATPNGLGNVIIGYDEGGGTQTGSNNLVLGDYQTFSSYGGIVGGSGNTVSGAFASALGAETTASGLDTSVTGGFNNTASDNGASVGGGEYNTANSLASQVLGANSTPQAVSSRRSAAAKASR
jgi:hypothetical protein